MAGQRESPPLRVTCASLGLRCFAVLTFVVGCKVPVVREAPAEVSAAPVRAAESHWLPSHERNWSPDLAVLPYAEFTGDRVLVHNIRNCAYMSDSDYVVQHYDRVFDLDEIRSVDFVVVPFTKMPSLAHTMLSFGFADGRHVAVSVEARLEEGETYSPLSGSLRQYELMYVIADERDVIVRRSLYRGADVYLYPTVATPTKARELFVGVMRRVNQIYQQPEFYDTLSNNCTTNLVQHVNALSPARIPFDVRTALTGFSDQVAYDLGLLRSMGSFEETRKRAHITAAANRFADSPDFSQRIRR